MAEGKDDVEASGLLLLMYYRTVPGTIRSHIHLLRSMEIVFH
jgi:hypothetical protein